MTSTSELYNVDNYTDQQLYDILDMNSPTDRELEAKLLHLIQKYTAMQTESGNQLAKFFEAIYQRFFSPEETEGFENPNKEKSDALQQQNITATQTFEYAQDKLQLNPLIKQTITRVISIDSQYRDVTTAPFTTNFTFDLSEPLRDVVSLKLYSVQIPYTWYTIAKSYGSNFFYLKGRTPGITDASYNYKIAIPPGNYTSNQLVAAINSSFQDVSNGAAADINFNGQPLLTYNSNTTKTTVNLNLQNTFNENYYSLNFPQDDTSIATYLGFNNQTYYPNIITSNRTAYRTTTLNSIGELAQNYVLDSSNNYFTVVQYLGLTPSTGYTGTQTNLNQVKITLLDSNNDPLVGNVARADIIAGIQAGLRTSNAFDSMSRMQQIDISNVASPNNGYSYFQFSLIWNRSTIKYVPNAKTAVIFPTEPAIPRQNQYWTASNTNETFSVWTYNTAATYNAFFFDNTTNPFSQITSESPYVNSTYILDDTTNMYFTCTAAGYNRNGLNDISLNVAQGVYTSYQFVNAISNSFITNNPRLNNMFNLSNTTAYIDNTNTFNMTIDMTKPFTNADYRIVIGENSILRESNQQTDSQNYDASFSSVGIPGTAISGNISYNTVNNGYLVDNSYILTVVPNPTSDNRYAGNVDVYLQNWTPPFVKYNGIDEFLANIQSAITSATVSIPEIQDVQTPFSKSTVIRSETVNANNRYDISLNMQCYYYLSEASYDISFGDSSTSFANSQWSRLNINPSYVLANYEQGAYVVIHANSSITSASLQVTNGANTLTFNTNPSYPAPADTITITIPPAIYTISELYAAINAALTANPKTYGSYITTYIDANHIGYSRFWINVNNVYTTTDYILDFWDPVSFITCFSGSSSVQNTTWDTTIGWILGFRDYTQYILSQANQTQNSNFANVHYYLNSTNGSYNYTPTYQGGQLISAAIQLTGDTGLTTNLFNYFLISLDDYIQNHLNDGLVTITRSQTAIQIPGYQYTTTRSCDPATNTLVTTAATQSNSDNATNNQLYALNQSVQSQQPYIQQYSPGPYIKDLFGIIPVKPPSNPGDTYTEFGGSLQNQTRMYFGPVNIRKMTIQLLNDRGDLVDLNGSNWTFSFVCEQLYRSSSAAT